MDLRKTILKEHSRAQAERIADNVGHNKARFKDLVEVYLIGPQIITQRAAWSISICIERYPHLIRPHLRQMLSHLDKPGIHNSVKRNTMRLLQFVEIPERFRGKVAGLCFRYLQDKKEPVAVRVFSMTVLGQIARTEPDLGRELRIIIEDHLSYASSAFVSRAKKTLKELDKDLVHRSS